MRRDLEDDDDVVADGESVRVPLYLCDDATQRAIATDGLRLHDGMGRPAGYKSGYVFSGNIEHSQRDAYDAAAVRALVMGEVERMANDPLPLSQRAPRIAALERELDQLHRVEEVLVTAAIAAGQSIHRSPTAPPAAVLGVRVAEGGARAT
jgi:hypothetical protein